MGLSGGLANNGGTTSLTSNSFLTSTLGPPGALAETFPFLYMGNPPFTPISGTLYLTTIALSANTAIGHIVIGASGTVNTPTHWWFGLYDNSRNQLAVTADQLTAAWNADTAQSLAIATITGNVAATSFTTTYTGLHYIGYCMVATGPTAPYGKTTPTLAIQSALSNVLLGASDTGITGGPPSFPHQAIAITGDLGQMYAYVTA